MLGKGHVSTKQCSTIARSKFEIEALLSRTAMLRENRPSASARLRGGIQFACFGEQIESVAAVLRHSQCSLADEVHGQIDAGLAGFLDPQDDRVKLCSRLAKLPAYSRANRRRQRSLIAALCSARRIHGRARWRMSSRMTCRASLSRA
jgi:hypothetical protein